MNKGFETSITKMKKKINKSNTNFKEQKIKQLGEKILKVSMGNRQLKSPKRGKI